MCVCEMFVLLFFRGTAADTKRELAANFFAFFFLFLSITDTLK